MFQLMEFVHNLLQGMLSKFQTAKEKLFNLVYKGPGFFSTFPVNIRRQLMTFKRKNIFFLKSNTTIWKHLVTDDTMK